MMFSIHIDRKAGSAEKKNVSGTRCVIPANDAARGCVSLTRRSIADFGIRRTATLDTSTNRFRTEQAPKQL
jgi:ribosomal protein S2